MKYVNNKFDKSKIIESFEKNGNFYSKEYMDGSFYDYYSNDENEITKIRNEMVNQAKERQAVMAPSYYKKRAVASLSASFIAFQLGNSIALKELSGYSLLLMLAGVIGFCEFIRDIKISRELKKYSKFLEMYDDIGWVKNLNHDIYSPELDIEMLDKFDNNYINEIYDNYKRIKKH